MSYTGPSQKLSNPWALSLPAMTSCMTVSSRSVKSRCSKTSCRKIPAAVPRGKENMSRASRAAASASLSSSRPADLRYDRLIPVSPVGHARLVADEGREAGNPPVPIDAAAERALPEFKKTLVRRRLMLPWGERHGEERNGLMGFPLQVLADRATSPRHPSVAYRPETASGRSLAVIFARLVEEVGGSGRPGIPKASPDQGAAMFGTGHGHIEQPKILRQLLLFRQPSRVHPAAKNRGRASTSGHPLRHER